MWAVLAVCCPRRGIAQRARRAWVDYACGAPTGRARALRVTAEGQRRLDAGDRALTQVNSMMLQGLSQSTQEELASLLLHCANTSSRCRLPRAATRAR